MLSIITKGFIIEKKLPDYMIKNGQKYKFVTNHLGSVVKVINVSNGNVEQ